MIKMTRKETKSWLNLIMDATLQQFNFDKGQLSLTGLFTQVIFSERRTNKTIGCYSLKSNEFFYLGQWWTLQHLMGAKVL